MLIGIELLFGGVVEVDEEPDIGGDVDPLLFVCVLYSCLICALEDDELDNGGEIVFIK